MTSVKPESVSFILTTYNDQDETINCIKKIIEINKKYKYDCEIIIIVDGDNQKLKKFLDNQSFIIEVIYRKINSGLASAINLGFIKSKNKFLCWVDVGMSYLIPQYFSSIIKMKNSDIVIFSRYFAGSDQRSLRRKFGSILINKTCQIFLGNEIADYTSGLFIINSELLHNFTPPNRGYGEYFIKFLYEIKKSNSIKITEVPYDHIYEGNMISNSYKGFFSYLLKGLYYFFYVIKVKLFK
tara:strand:- start:188 stop:907 length:720 start_codon:yes stop_codon:yes gene_type:complete